MLYGDRFAGVFYGFYYRMRPNAPSSANANNTHHQEHLRTFASFKIINIIVNIFDSFCVLVVTHCDYIQIFFFFQSSLCRGYYICSFAHDFNSSLDTSTGKRCPDNTIEFGLSVFMFAAASVVDGVLPDVANGIIVLPAKS